MLSTRPYETVRTVSPCGGLTAAGTAPMRTSVDPPAKIIELSGNPHALYTNGWFRPTQAFVDAIAAYDRASWEVPHRPFNGRCRTFTAQLLLDTRRLLRRLLDLPGRPPAPSGHAVSH